eukprot:11386678-Heterocapsa_arctica.AAC.1
MICYLVPGLPPPQLHPDSNQQVFALGVGGGYLGPQLRESLSQSDGTRATRTHRERSRNLGES